MTSTDIRETYLAFFKKRDHAIIPSASLLPENDPSVLFTTAGMQPLVPYLMGQTHPAGTRLANLQKVVRTNDIDEVGDNTHLTFFEMMGNWSLGDYFKQEAITWSWELLTNPTNLPLGDRGFGLDPQRLYVTIFEGNNDAPRDEESYQIWSDLFTKAGLDPTKRIFFMSAEANWWSPGDNGPCGPDTEMFYDVSGKHTGGLTKEEFLAADDNQEIVEIWNDVFMEYQKEQGRVVGKLEAQNVDTGSGYERVVAVLQGKNNVFETDLFNEVFTILGTETSHRSARIIADHIRAAVMMISDGAVPSNTDAGYVLRRLIRRAVLQNNKLQHNKDVLTQIADHYYEYYRPYYFSENVISKEMILQTLTDEITKFEMTLERGLKEFYKATENENNTISGQTAFVLETTYGFPYELTQELAAEKGLTVDEKDYRTRLEEHKTTSRTASAGKFKGGLAGHGTEETKLHTATHLLNAALRQVLGEHVSQKGSNITSDRLRFDFTHPTKMTAEEKQAVTELVNQWIAADLPVTKAEMSVGEAKEQGAIGVFGDKYGDTVTVYTVGDKEIASKEICGGPHVEHTAELGTFRIKKEEASSAGVRRIKAVLE